MIHIAHQSTMGNEHGRTSLDTIESYTMTVVLGRDISGVMKKLSSEQLVIISCYRAVLS